MQAAGIAFGLFFFTAKVDAIVSGATLPNGYTVRGVWLPQHPSSCTACACWRSAGWHPAEGLLSSRHHTLGRPSHAAHTMAAGTMLICASSSGQRPLTTWVMANRVQCCAVCFAPLTTPP